jgi:hypothetical protein
MRRTGFVVLVVLSLAVTAGAQTKMSGKLQCAKSDPDYAIEVGDRPGHVMTARKAACTWTEGVEIAGLKAKTGQDVATGEVSGATLRDSGFHTATMDNGDKFTVRFTGTGTLNKDKSGSFEGTWTIVSGTGKLKGVKGSGTFKGSGSADGSSDVQVEGEYTMPAAKTTAAKAPGA